MTELLKIPARRRGRELLPSLVLSARSGWSWRYWSGSIERGPGRWTGGEESGGGAGGGTEGVQGGSRRRSRPFVIVLLVLFFLLIAKYVVYHRNSFSTFPQSQSRCWWGVWRRRGWQSRATCSGMCGPSSSSLNLAEGACHCSAYSKLFVALNLAASSAARGPRFSSRRGAS